MTTPIAAVAAKFFVTATNVAPLTADELKNVRECNVARSFKTQDATPLGQGGYEVQAATLKTFSLDLTCLEDPADAVQTLLTGAVISGATVWVTVETNPSGTTGLKGFTYPVLVTEKSNKLGDDGLLEAAYKMAPAGAPATI